VAAVLQRHPREDELKATLVPCAHCGAKATLRIIEDYNSVQGRRAFYRVHCSDDCIREYRVDLEDAVRRWNGRK
jgi:hypothetical protein